MNARVGVGFGVGVKICGVTRAEDALAAVRLGANAIGFNFYPRSRRYLSPSAAAEIVSQLPPEVTAVGVFVDASAEEIASAARTSGISSVQLHGAEEPSLLSLLDKPVIKALPATVEVASQMRRFAADAFLIDAPVGGSGKTFDWSLAQGVPRTKPLYLAGGLDPSNVAAAIRTVRPDFVDVASGVEDAPGIKNHERMAQFIRAAKELRDVR